MRTLYLLTLLAVTPAFAYAQDDDDEWLSNCESTRWNGRRPAACEVRVQTFPARALLTVRPGQNGATMIIAHAANTIEVHARVHASAYSRGDAAELLRGVKVDFGETLTASGPGTGSGESWSVSFVIYVPRSQNVDVVTQNGPISVKNVVGKMELRARNGPIALSGVGGDVHARAQNGPLHVRLTGSRWTGAGLDAETQNGPVSLVIPQEYNAALETGTVNGPMNTDFPITVTLTGRQWKRLSTQLGSGGAPVRVVTTNGPVSLRRP